MRQIKLIGGAAALVTAALVGGTLISAVAASPGSSGSTAPAAADFGNGAYCTAFREALAAKLGVSADELVAAGKDAATETIDEMVANGDLDADVAANLKERIAAADADGCGLFGMRLHAAARGAMRGAFHADLVNAAADALGVDVTEVRGNFADGQSLQEMAEAAGKDYDAVTQQIHDAAKADLDEAVANGTITQERADTLLERIDSWLDSGGQPGARLGDGPRAGRGMRSFPGNGNGTGNGTGFGNGFGIPDWAPAAGI